MPRALRLILPAAVLLTAASVLGTHATPEASAQGGPPAQPGPAVNPAAARGLRLFDQAVSWINDGKPGINNVKSFFAALDSVQLDVRDTHQEGYLRLWFAAPDKFRQEWRQQKALVAGSTTTKILSGQRMWIIGQDNAVKRVHGTTDGAAAIAQLQDDRNRLADLARFLTLGGLKGPGVSFEDMGPTEAGGPFAGKWIRVKRTLRGGAAMMFYFAYQADAAGRPVAVTYPGVVVVLGDATKKEPTEAYVLKNWKRGPQFRFPTHVEAYAREDWVAGAQFRKFLQAYPSDIRINPVLDPKVIFTPPQPRR